MKNIFSINSSNAKLISDALINLSQRMNKQMIFNSLKVLPLNNLLRFFSFLWQRNSFQSIDFFSLDSSGITAQKNILRLLIEVRSNSNCIVDLIEPLRKWNLHRNVRTALIFTQLHFLISNDLNEKDFHCLMSISDQSTDEEYLPLLQCFFSNERDKNSSILHLFRISSEENVLLFVNRIEMKILDHPKSIEVRLLAWKSIEYRYVDQKIFLEKVRQLSIEFDDYSNQLWPNALTKLLQISEYQSMEVIDHWSTSMENVFHWISANLDQVLCNEMI